MEVLTHLFGSVDGYRTLANSPGLIDTEIAALGAMGFGSPQRAEEFDDLERNPCMAGRLLPSGRYAITRLFKGALDVAGRQTVERRTLVLTGEQWSRLIHLDLRAMLARPETWDRGAFEAGRPIRLQAIDGEELLPSPSEVDRRVYDALLSAHASGRCAMLPREPRFNQAVLRLPTLMPVEEALCFGWGVGLWNIPAGVWLATVREFTRQRNAFVAATAGAWRHPQRLSALDHTRRPPGVRVQMEAIEPSPTGHRRIALVAGAIILVACMLLALLLWLTGEQVKVRQAAGPTTESSRPLEATPPPPSVPATPPPTMPPPDEPAAPAPESMPAVTTPQDPGPGFGSTPADGTAFGQDSAGTETPPAPSNIQPSAPPATPPAGQAPPSTPAPPPTPPSIPAPPATNSAPWDAEVASLRESVALTGRVMAACDLTTPPEAELAELAHQVCEAASAIDLASRDLTQDRLRCRIFNFGTKGAGEGLADELRGRIAMVRCP